MAENTPPVSRWQFRIKYFINGKNFEDFKVYVKSVDGILDMPKRKIAYRHNWLDQDGEEVDLDTFIFEARTFKLNCFIVGDSIDSTINNLNSFFKELDIPGPRLLEIQYYTTDYKLSFNVYREDEVKVSKPFRYAKNVWTFNLILKEYIE